MAKYKIPWTSKEAQEAIPYDMLVEFYEDFYEKHPKEAMKLLADEDGNVVFEDTGDALMDRWERLYAKGVLPDLLSDLDPKDKGFVYKQAGKYIEEANDVPFEEVKRNVHTKTLNELKQKMGNSYRDIYNKVNKNE